jgi:hypothetical protein
MIPRVKPEGMLFGKPVSTPQQVRGTLFRIMPWSLCSVPIGSERNSLVLTRFLHANRYPPPDQIRGHASLENALMSGSGEHDIGPDREPEGVVADNRDLDEHTDDRNDHENQRDHESKIHCASPMRCDETPITALPIGREWPRARPCQSGAGKLQGRA